MALVPKCFTGWEHGLIKRGPSTAESNFPEGDLYECQGGVVPNELYARTGQYALRMSALGVQRARIVTGHVEAFSQNFRFLATNVTIFPFNQTNWTVGQIYSLYRFGVIDIDSGSLLYGGVGLEATGKGLFPASQTFKLAIIKYNANGTYNSRTVHPTAKTFTLAMINAGTPFDMGWCVLRLDVTNDATTGTLAQLTVAGVTMTTEVNLGTSIANGPYALHGSEKVTGGGSDTGNTPAYD